MLLKSYKVERKRRKKKTWQEVSDGCINAIAWKKGWKWSLEGHFAFWGPMHEMTRQLFHRLNCGKWMNGENNTMTRFPLVGGGGVKSGNTSSTPVLYIWINKSRMDIGKAFTKMHFRVRVSSHLFLFEGVRGLDMFWNVTYDLWLCGKSFKMWTLYSDFL